MEFFNKKQDVIDVELTSYGKQLLSRGFFKPAYYAFSDDGVLYDQKWMSGSLIKEQQSQIEPRIQENTPRLKTQSRKVGAERAIYNWTPHYTFHEGFQAGNHSQNLQDIFELSEAEVNEQLGKLSLKVGFAESEKLLESKLGTKSYFNNYNPAWNLLLYNGNISDSTKHYQKKDFVSLIPQINCTLEDTVYKISTNQQITKIIMKIKNLENNLNQSKGISSANIDNYNDINNLYFQEFNLEDGDIFIEKDFLFISLEEANSVYDRDNFSVEVFEVTDKTLADDDADAEEILEKMPFSSEVNFLVANPVENVFEIEMDEEIDALLACSLIGKDKDLKEQSVYSTKIFDCERSIPTTANVDPYSNLPPVDLGDVC